MKQWAETKQITDKVWAKFAELLSLNLHEGDKEKAEERPATNLLGSINWHKKVFDQAVAAVDEEVKADLDDSWRSHNA